MTDAVGRCAYCLAMAMQMTSFGSIRWSWLSSPRSICTRSIFPLNMLVPSV